MNIHGNSQNGIRKLWSWFRGAPSLMVRCDDYCRARLVSDPAHIDAIGASQAMLRTNPQSAMQDRVAESGVVLQFPLRGEALLVRLADLLRRRIASRVVSRVPERDPLLLTMSRCPGSRLSIDRCAYVEFNADQSAFLVVIEAAPDTRITLDTTDFDATVNFVVQYIAERLSTAATLEVAS